MIFAVTLITGLFTYDNLEFFSVVKQQRSEGYTWSDIECRQVEVQPALTIDTPTGKKLVCYKLEK